MSKIDVKTLELMASKICHDLISPIGAINNGLEIFEEMGPDAGSDVTDLIAHSASVASAKLKAYRIAYGAGGADSTVKPADVHAAIGAIIAHEKRLTQDWDPAKAIAGAIIPKAYSKMLAAFLLLIMECLPRGGVISARAGDNGTLVIHGAGEGAFLKDGFADALNLKADLKSLPTAATHAYMSGLLADHYGYAIAGIDAADNSVSFTLQPPAE